MKIEYKLTLGQCWIKVSTYQIVGTVPKSYLHEPRFSRPEVRYCSRGTTSRAHQCRVWCRQDDFWPP